MASAPPDNDSNISFPALLSVKGITKSFSGIKANNNVDFEVRPGEVHSLLGENGAGKTTLINILYGLYQPDDGEINFKGNKVVLRSPKDAIKYGLGLVAQHFHLARRHTVAENVALGLSGTPMFFPTKILRGQLRRLGEHYGLKVDPNARIWQLSPGEQQRVEILKVLIQGAEILILDEPTSVLTPQESDALFRVLKKLTGEGKAVIFISHKLDEVMRIADKVSVLRKGNLVGCFNNKDTSPAELAKLMIGRTIAPPKRTDIQSSRSVLLELKSAWVQNDRGANALRNICFYLRRSEILGVAGVAGNGQGELTEVLTGLRYLSRGQIILDGEDVTQRGVRGFFEGGVAHIPEDRNHMGIVPSMSVAENLIMRHYRHKPFAKGPMIDQREVAQFAIESIDKYSIATASKDTPSRQLSGGNVQKIILARELSGDPKLLVASHPTYGLDVAATSLTHELLLSQRARGAGILLVSEDLDELIKISDRILVLFEGTIMGPVDTNEVNSQTLGAMMAGVAVKDGQGSTTSA